MQRIQRRRTYARLFLPRRLVVRNLARPCHCPRSARAPAASDALAFADDEQGELGDAERPTSLSSAAPVPLVTEPKMNTTQGNIAKWKVKEGDKIKAGDVLAEIETVRPRARAFTGW